MADGDTIQNTENHEAGEPRPDTGGPDATQAVPWRIEPRGTTVLAVEDPADVSLTIADALSADLVLGGDDLTSVLDDRAERQANRRAAEQALAVFDRVNERPTADLHVLADTDELRRLAHKLRRAGSIIEDTTHEVARRYGEAQGRDLAVHPDTIRRSAAELLEARGAVDALQAELDRHLADDGARGGAAPGADSDDPDDPDDHRDPWGDDAPDLSGVDAFGAAGDEDAARVLEDERRRFGRRKKKATADADLSEASPEPTVAEVPEDREGRRVEDDEDDADTRVVLRAVAVVVAALVIAVAVSVAGIIAYGLGFVLPLLALVHAIGMIRERRVDRRDRSMASDNLAVVRAITDQAYGGSIDDLRPPHDDDLQDVLDAEPRHGVADIASDTAEHQDPAEDPEVASLRTRLRAATGRRQRVQESWESLVGPGADPADLDAVLRARDAQYALTDEQLQTLPSVRAVNRFERRLQARWKVLWAALDRDPPSVDAADAAIDALEADDVFAVTVAKHQEDPAQDARRQRLLADFDELSHGASAAELRSRAQTRLRPVVVAVEDGEIDLDRIERRRPEIGDELQVVVVTRS